jgi:hypothetical protein
MKVSRASALGKGWRMQAQPWMVMGPAAWAALRMRSQASLEQQQMKNIGERRVFRLPRDSWRKAARTPMTSRKVWQSALRLAPSLVAHDFEEVEAGAAAGTPGIGRDAKEAALCLVFVAVDGGEEEVDELGPEVVGGGIFDFGGEELVRVEGAGGHDELVVAAEVPVLEGKS